MSVQKPEKIPSKLYMADELIEDEYMEFEEPVIFEQVDIPKVSEQELIQETVKFKGIINTENISPPPYDADEIFEYTDDPPEYSVPYIDPPEYSPNPEIKLKLLKKFTIFFAKQYRGPNGNWNFRRRI